MKNISNVSLVEGNPNDNVSREGSTVFELLFAEKHFNKFKTLALSISQGFNPAYPLVVREVKKEEAKELLQLREERYNKLCDAIESTDNETIAVGEHKLSPQIQLQAFRALYMKDGKLIKPQYAVVSGFRRYFTVEYAQSIRVAQGNDSLIEVNAVVRDYAELSDQYADTIAENNLKSEGVDKLTDRDVLAAVAALYRADPSTTEADLIRKAGFKRGTAQKVARAWKLHAKFPNLDLWGRSMLAESSNEYIAFKSLDKEAMQKLIRDNATQDEVATYLSKPKKGNNKDKIAERKKIVESSENHTVKIVQVVLEAVVKNDLKSLKFSEDETKALNQVYTEIMSKR